MPNIIDGTNNNDIINDTTGDDSITAMDGNDTIYVTGGTDYVNAGAGDDVIIYTGGDLTLDAGDGHDTVDTRGAAQGSNWDSSDDNELEDFLGSAFNDIFTTTGSVISHMLDGGDGDDVLDGGEADDHLIGGAGIDWLTGNGGNDILDGGDGASDYANYYGSTVDVTANLETGIATGQGLGTDTLVNIEFLYGGAGNDTLTGDAGANDIYAAEGNDALSGGEGNDRLFGGAGNDSLNGGNGKDTVFYFDDTQGVVASLADGTASGAGIGNDTLVSIEDLRGGAGNDSLAGDALDNDLWGSEGQDALVGADGNDHLYGGTGDDTLDGGNGFDFAEYFSEGSAVTVNLATGVATGASIGTDTLISIEIASGGWSDDTLIGNAENNDLYGNAGNDHLEGADGNDRLFGGPGDDTLDGGNGKDTVWFYDDVQGVVASLEGGTATGAGIGTDTLVSIEDLRGGFGNDTLSGDASDNDLWGNNGEDVLSAGAGNDHLYGGFGDDVLDGGEGVDFAEYFNEGGVVTASLLTGTATGTTIGTDTLVGIEGLSGGVMSDFLTGNEGGNDLYGNAGDDTLQSGGGNDRLFGGIGNDWLDGGDGTDLVWYYEDSQGVTASLVSGTASGTGIGADTLIGIEDLGGGSGKDTLTGSSVDNVLSGWDGADTLSGGGGHDRLDGGTGADKMSGGSGDDTYVVDSALDKLTETNNQGMDTIEAALSYALTGLYIENLVLTGAGNFSATGNGYANVLIGNGGDNALNGNRGADRMSGGLGNDIYYVENALDLVFENAGEGIDSVIAQISYTLTDGVEKLALTGFQALNGTGNALDNTLNGNANVNTLNGGDGKDTLNGQGGNDILTGGAGADIFRFSRAGAANGLDHITDFVSGTDKLQFAAADFGFARGHVLTAAEFHAGGAVGMGTQFLYNSVNHTLYWDSDGAGGAAPISVAVFDNGAALKATDFVFL